MEIAREEGEPRGVEVAEVTRTRGRRCGWRYAPLDGDAAPRELRAEVNRARTWKAPLSTHATSSPPDM